MSSKIGVIESLLNKVDKLFLGGGMIFTFYKAQGKSTGSSLVELDKVSTARAATGGGGAGMFCARQCGSCAGFAPFVLGP